MYTYIHTYIYIYKLVNSNNFSMSVHPSIHLPDCLSVWPSIWTIRTIWPNVWSEQASWFGLAVGWVDGWIDGWLVAAKLEGWVAKKKETIVSPHNPYSSGTINVVRNQNSIITSWVTKLGTILNPSTVHHRQCCGSRRWVDNTSANRPHIHVPWLI